MDPIEHNGRLIRVSYVCPPVPVRGADWCAWFDDEGEEAGNYGRGETAKDAVFDLIETHGDDNA